jgi:hypothetical protein
MGVRGSPPFEGCDSTLELAEDVGIGTRDLRRIEVVGVPIESVMFDFEKMRVNRRANPRFSKFGPATPSPSRRIVVHWRARDRKTIGRYG